MLALCRHAVYLRRGVRRPVTNHIPDTPDVAIPWCPGCEPEVDPTEEVVDVRYCSVHQPPSHGLEDGLMDQETYPAGSNEAGGSNNRAFCAFFHRAQLVTG